MDTNTFIQLPVVALRGLTVMPDMIIHFDLSRDKSIAAVENAMLSNQQILLVTQRDVSVQEPDFDSVYHVGTIAIIKQVTKLPNKVVRVLVEGIKRAKLSALYEQNNRLVADLEEFPLLKEAFDENEETGRVTFLKELLGELVIYQPKMPKNISTVINETDCLFPLLQKLSAILPFTYQLRQSYLEAETEEELYDLLARDIANEIEVCKVKAELSAKIKGQVEKHQKEYILREQMQYIRKELGEDEDLPDADRFEEECKKITASKEVKEKIRKAIARFRNVSGSSSESAVERAYLETLLEMPWDKVSKDNLDIERAEEILNQDHYGLTKVKERILEFLAVRTLTKHGDSPIICLVGPPGTGKTSIAKSVASALNKKYVRICLGGVRDEAEIRGHRKTYVGAMSGRIAGGLRQAGVKNPLMLLDEIDKLGDDYKGDPASALLEVLDSEQNGKFRDHYIEIPIDLSQVLFIATANSASDIPRPLLDRMEIIEVNSYTTNEKFHIAKEHLWKKQLAKNGLSNAQLQISDKALQNLIVYYTKEAGVRELERKIGKLCQKTAREILTTKKPGVKITEKNLKTYLGKPQYLFDMRNEADAVGVVRGLAWTSVGGETLQIEVNIMSGKGEIDLTGQLGDVMKESAVTGMSYIRSVGKKYHIAADFFKKNDIHIHIPEGAVPKDGPSAGITMACALLSAITNTPVYANLAMTGEVTLRGRVLPIGGLKEKILAAKLAGITKVLVPEKNKKDIEEMEKEITEGINIVFVSSMDEVISNAFVKDALKTKRNEESNEN